MIVQRVAGGKDFKSINIYKPIEAKSSQKLLDKTFLIGIKASFPCIFTDKCLDTLVSR